MVSATHTKGEKAMMSSSIEGASVLQQELEALDRDWDALLSRLSDVRVTLETCLMQWSDYDERSEQVQKWLKDMERKVKDFDLKANMPEKKAQLQKAKVRYIDHRIIRQSVEETG